jgi:A/G-specific adenine glycosylase
MPELAAKLIRWQKLHGRHDLPWQRQRDPYLIWVSEIMLQQTQVATVIPYYRRFVERFPDIASLARAPLDDVLALWSGLGYYSRARNLHGAAQLIQARHAGRFPVGFEEVMALPGVGRSTASAICVFGFGQLRAILDGNVKRVLARLFAVHGYPGEAHTAARLWELSERLLPDHDIEAYTQGLMDLGAGVCTRTQPNCPRCPLSSACAALRAGIVNQLPQAKPRKALPQKRTVMLVLQRAGSVLLEKRPPVGIWGGLWCFPEADASEDAAASCARRFGALVEPLGELPTIAHGFTHFRLEIRPLALKVIAHESRASEPGYSWLPVQQALAAAIPAPVRRILATL